MNARWKHLSFLILLAAMGFAPQNALAHAVVFPKSSEAGAYEKYVLRVPNERDVAATRVEIRFPRSVRVISFADVPGWSLEILTDSVKHVIGAVWSGSLPPQRFVEFAFVAVNPTAPAKLLWPTFQTYLNGERVDWIGPEDAKFPASATQVVPAPRRGTGIIIALWVCIAALVLSIAALFLALRPERRAHGFQPGS